MSLLDTAVIELNATEGGPDHVAISEFDDQTNIDELGEVFNTYPPNSSFNVWLHLSDNVKFDFAKVSNGSIVATGASTRTVTRRLVFDKFFETTEHITSVIPQSISLGFYGSKGEPTQDIQPLGTIKFIGSDKVNVPYIMDATMSIKVLTFKVTTPDIILADGESYPLVIAFYLQEA